MCVAGLQFEIERVVLLISLGYVCKGTRCCADRSNVTHTNGRELVVKLLHRLREMHAQNLASFEWNPTPPPPPNNLHSLFMSALLLEQEKMECDN